MANGRNHMEYNVTIRWDNEAAVWIATSEDIPGLVLESGSFDALIERVKTAAPELLALNNQPALTAVNISAICRQAANA